MSVSHETGFEELLATSRLSKSYFTLDEENSMMKKIILVWGLPGAQASSVATALVGKGPGTAFCGASNNLKELEISFYILFRTDIVTDFNLCLISPLL